MNLLEISLEIEDLKIKMIIINATINAIKNAYPMLTVV